MQCTAAAAKTDLRSSRPAETVADTALQRCKAQEQPLARALNRQLGKEGTARVLELVRETDRSNLIRVIEELSGSSGMLWGMMAVSPRQEICHACPSDLPARADC